MAHAYQLGRARANGSETTRIFWDESEKRKVAMQSYHLIKADPSISHLDAVMAAQRKVLKPDRVRTVSTFGKFAPWIKPMWDAIEAEKKTQAVAAQGAADLFKPETIEQVPSKEFMQAEVVADEAASSELPPALPENQTVVFADDGRVFQKADGVNIDTPAQTGPTRKPTVRWNDEEMRKLAARVHYLLKSFADMRPLEALRKANESELPGDRQRDISTWAMVEGWLDPMLQQLKIDEQLAELQAKDARETAERVAREARERAEAEEARIAAIVEERVEMQVAARMAEQRPVGLEAIIQLFALRFAETLVPAMSHAVMQAASLQIANINFGQPAKEEARLVTPPKDRLPKLCIVGLLNQQAEDVQKAFLGTVEFVFVKSQAEGGGGHGGAGMLTKSASCDLVIAMVDHMGKDVDASAKHLKIPYHRVNGSASACKRFITSWLNGSYSGVAG